MIKCVLTKIGKRILAGLSEAANLLGALVIVVAAIAIPFLASVAIIMLVTGQGLDVSARATGLSAAALVLWLLLSHLLQQSLVEIKKIVEECKGETNE